MSTEALGATDYDLDPEVNEPDGLASSGSVLNHVRSRRDDLASNATPELTLEVPDGALGVRYRYPEGGADPIIRAFDRTRDRGQNEMVFGAARVVAACCAEVVGRRPGGEWESLDPTDERPLRFSRRLADLLQIDLPPDGEAKPSEITRLIVRHVFSPRARQTGVYDGDIALLVQAGDVIDWLRTGLQDSSEDLEGE